MSIADAVEQLHSSEHELLRGLLNLAELHRDEAEVQHLARDLAGWSAEHVRLLAEAGAGRGLALEPSPAGGLRAAWRIVTDAADRRTPPGMRLLRDLRAVHVLAAGVSVDWEVLAQAAQASRDEALQELATRCHPQTLRQLRWAHSLIKVGAAQAVLSS